MIQIYRQQLNQSQEQSQYQGIAINKNNEHNLFMVFKDRRTYILSQNDIFSAQSIEEVKQIRYKTKNPYEYKESKGLRPTLQNHMHEGRTPNENQHFRDYIREAKEEESNLIEDVKIILIVTKRTINFQAHQTRIGDSVRRLKTDD